MQAFYKIENLPLLGAIFFVKKLAQNIYLCKRSIQRFLRAET